MALVTQVIVEVQPPWAAQRPGQCGAECGRTPGVH
jgi:hypothetical protein